MISSLLFLAPFFALDPGGGSATPGIAADAPGFDAPVLLTAGNKPMGRGILYPSPVLFDIDQDGDIELIMGDLWGRLHVAEPTPGKRTLAWGESKPMDGADGDVLKFSNW